MDKFRENPKLKEYAVPMPRNDAYTVKTQFYRFFDQIRLEYEEAQLDPDKAAAAHYSGLHDFFHLANNLVPSARHDGNNWFFVLRQTVASDELVRRTADDVQFLTTAARKIKQVNIDEDERTYQRIAAGSATDTKEELLAKADKGELSFEEMFGGPPTK